MRSERDRRMGLRGEARKAINLVRRGREASTKLAALPIGLAWLNTFTRAAASLPEIRAAHTASIRRERGHG